MKVVFLKLDGALLVQVPLLNFQAFVPQKIKLLELEFAESEEHRLKYYTYDTTFLAVASDVRTWACWLETRDVGNLVGCLVQGRAYSRSIYTALQDADLLEDVDYRDALIDAWMIWLKELKPTGTLAVDRLRHFAMHGHTVRLGDLLSALILHHDPKAVLTEDQDKPQYTIMVCNEVRSRVVSYFSQSEREPEDPLQLSDDEFCKKYHSHHKKGQPCYKTKALPKEA
jgi:hypothetical protein